MKRFLPLLVLPLCPLRAADPTVVNGSVISLMGDSYLVPNSGSWAYYFQSYMVNRHPDKLLHIHNLGRSGSSLLGWMDGAGVANEEFRKWIVPLQPDFVVMMTMSNGGNSATYQTALEDFVPDYITGITGAEAIFPGYYASVYKNSSTYLAWENATQTVAQSYDPDLPFSHTFNLLKPLFTDTAKAVLAEADDDTILITAHGYANGTRVIFDLGGSPAGPAGITTGAYRYVVNATANTFQVSATEGGAALDITTDGAGGHSSWVSDKWPHLRYAANDDHPSHVAGILFAYTFMQQMNYASAVCDATINGGTATLTSDNDCTVTSVAANAFGGINFNMLPARLEWSLHDELIATAELLIPGCTSWQTRTLTVTGLSAGTYDILEGGIDIGDATHTALAAGVNLAAFHVGPTHDQHQAILASISAMQDMNATTLAPIAGNNGIEIYTSNANASYTTNSGAAGAAAHAAALADEITDLHTLDAAIKTAAQPVTRTYSLRLQGYTGTGTATATSITVTGTLTVGE